VEPSAPPRQQLQRLARAQDEAQLSEPKRLIV